MSVDEATAETADFPRLRGHLRLRAGLRKPSNWIQLVRFAVVGASGYVVNLAVFTLLVHGAGVDYLIAAVVAFAVALSNNFICNRLWTFAGTDGHVGFQAARFCVVSLAAFGFNLVVLYTLVEGVGVSKVPAQALAIAAATPLNFIGNKLWSFRA
jgi:dolichol-phosphate mannosyltransferase